MSELPVEVEGREGVVGVVGVCVFVGGEGREGGEREGAESCEGSETACVFTLNERPTTRPRLFVVCVAIVFVLAFVLVVLNLLAFMFVDCVVSALVVLLGVRVPLITEKFLAFGLYDCVCCPKVGGALGDGKEVCVLVLGGEGNSSPDGTEGVFVFVLVFEGNEGNEKPDVVDGREGREEPLVVEGSDGREGAPPEREEEEAPESEGGEGWPLKPERDGRETPLEPEGNETPDREAREDMS